MNWKKVKLGEICEINMGKTPSRANPKYWGEGNNWVSIADLSSTKNECFIKNTKEQITDLAVKESGIKLVPTNTLLYSFKLSIGKVAITQTPLFTNEAIVALPIKDKNELDVKYLYHAIQRIDLEGVGDKAVKGITLNKEKLKVLEIPLPDLATQKHIAEVLDKADSLRQQNRQLLANYDELLQSTFIELFGDPVKNPKGWEVKNLKSISEKFMDGPFGSNLKTEHYQESGIRVIRLGNIGVGEFLDENKAFISKEHYEKVLKRNTCVAGDVIIGTMGEPNLRACILPKEIEVAVNKADCILFKPNTKETNSTYICNLLNLPNTLELASKMMHGQTRVRISMGQLQHLPIPVPPLPLQQHFAKIVEQIETQKSQAHAALAESEALFEGLLAGYFK